MRPSPRRDSARALRDVAVAMGLAALACVSVACGTDDARFQLEDRLRRAASSSKEGIPRYARALRDKASCLSSEVTDRIGGDDVERLIDARGDLGQVGDQVSTHLGELREAVHSCVDVR